MMEKQFLNEHKYQHAKKGLIITAITVIVTAITISSVFLLYPGFRKLDEANKMVVPTEQELKDQNDAKLAAIKERNNQKSIAKQKAIDEVDAKYEPIITGYETQLTDLGRQKTSVFMDGGFSGAYYALEDQITALRKQESDADNKKADEISVIDSNQAYSKEPELSGLDSVGSYQFDKQKKQSETIPYFIGGVMLILIGLGFGAQLLIWAFGRNIFAFGAQSTVPVAKEVIEDMAPTIGKAYGDAAKAAAPAIGSVAKEISKGIKEGLDDEKSKK